jgi:hypothetical protein
VGSGGEVEIAFKGSIEKPEASSSSELSHKPDHSGEAETLGGGVVVVPASEVGA